MFEPPCCPSSDCDMHRRPRRRFWLRDGHFLRHAYPFRVPRFRCRHCGKRFSRQTFRMNYRLRRPDLDAAVVTSLVSGTGIRQTARMLRVRPETVALRLRRYGEQLRHLHYNLLAPLEPLVELHLDELETFEGCRRTRPLTVPIAIDSRSYFVFDALSETLPPRGRLDARHRRIKESDERRHGKRRNRSSQAVAAVLGRVARLCDRARTVVLRSDRKRSYPGLAKAAFGDERLLHLRTSSKAPRTTWNPLFPINLTNAMARDLMGRLHRRSWLASKKKERLDDHLAIWMVYRNYHRYWKNGESDTPAMRLGMLDEQLPLHRAMSWRQDLGPNRSLHPMSHRGETVDEYRAVCTRCATAAGH